MCRKQPGIAIGRLCDKCDGKCPVCDSYVRPTTLVRICDECSFGNYQNKCVVCGGEVSGQYAHVYGTKHSLTAYFIRVSLMLSTASNVRDWRKIEMDVRKSSIWGALGPIYSIRKRTFEITEIRESIQACPALVCKRPSTFI